MAYEWREDLPERCPPMEAKTTSDYYYRLTNNFPPTDLDFVSKKIEEPDRKFKCGECIARACSVFSEKSGCENQKKLPLHKNQKVVRVKLDESSGLVMQTGRDKKHYSWWRDRRFNIVTASSLEA